MSSAAHRHEHGDGDALIHGARVYALRKRLWGPGARWRTSLVDRLNLHPGDRVLDVASGTGELALELARRVVPGGSVDGIDGATEMVEMATRKAVRAGRPAAFRTGLAQHLPFPDETFDALTCTLAVHHIAGNERATAFAEFQRVLRPGGTALIADVQEPSGRLARFLTRRTFAHALSHRPLEQAAELLEAAGFTGITRADTRAGWIGLVTGTKPS